LDSKREISPPVCPWIGTETAVCHTVRSSTVTDISQALANDEKRAKDYVRHVPTGSHLYAVYGFQL
jgi:hypothetical protein